MEQQLLHVTKAIEKQVDAALEQIENLDVNDLEQLRKNRLKEMQKLENKKREWLQNDHGKYEELPEEKCFFDVIKKSENVIIHFYTNSSERCQIVDKHLKILAPKHIETRFTKLNAEKCPFLSEKLKIKVIPTIVMIQNTTIVDKIIGFTQLGNRDDFSTDVLEWRLAQNELIKYDGDLTTPPDQQVGKKSQIRPIYERFCSGFIRAAWVCLKRQLKMNTRQVNELLGYGKKIRDSAFNRDDEDLDIEKYGLKADNSKSDMLDLRKAQSTELTAEELAELDLLE